MRALLKTTLAWLVLSTAAVGCGSSIGLLPAKTCAGGNIEDCRSTCDGGDAQSCYRLGWFYEEGEVLNGNMRKAIQLYDKSCTANWAVACRALGIIYWNGKEVDRNAKKAVDYYTKACKLGLPEACPTRTEVAIATGKNPADVQLTDDQRPDGPQTPDAPAAPAVTAPKTPQADIPTGIP